MPAKCACRNQNLNLTCHICVIILCGEVDVDDICPRLTRKTSPDMPSSLSGFATAFTPIPLAQRIGSASTEVAVVGSGSTARPSLAWSKIPETDLFELFVDDAFGISDSLRVIFFAPPDSDTTVWVLGVRKAAEEFTEHTKAIFVGRSTIVLERRTDLD